MNYWLAGVTNLNDLTLPLLDYVDSLREPGHYSAHNYFNASKGWIVNAPTNIFGCTGIGPGLDWGYNVGGAAWIMQNIYDIYRYGGDKEMLKERIYPMMKEVTEFWLEQLQSYRVNVNDESDGDEYLIVVPSFSAEHGPITKATTYDQTLVRQHFSNTVEII